MSRVEVARTKKAKGAKTIAAERQGVSLDEALARAEEHRSAGRLGTAADICRAVLAAQPDEPHTIHMLGVLAHEAGKLDEAIEHIRRAISIAPQVPLFHANLGEMLRQAGRPEDAIAEGRRAIALKPNYAEALSNLGAAFYECKQYEESAEHHRRAIEVKPNLARAHSNLGNALHALKRFDEAIAAYRRALALDPNFADAWSNLGTTLHHKGRYEEGMAHLRRAIAIDPLNANAHSGLGILLLMRGDFGEGWDEYEWRLRSSEAKGPVFPERPWQGESLAGRTIYVQAEQGFGDTIQFARYLPRLTTRAATVRLRVPQPLLRLMRTSLEGVELFGDRGPATAADCDCALLSLARIFKTRAETIPAGVPYLRPPPDVTAAWRQRLGAKQGFKVGVAWAGRPEHANDFRRSLDLSALAPIFSVADVSFASLQIGPATAALAARPEIADLSPHIEDFADTAGAIAALDLVIAVDTSVAHLAGALGKPVWVMLPQVNDWRWLLDRDDNPWYPTMRLFRPRDAEHWPDIIARTAAALAAVVGGDAARLTPFKQVGERRAAMAAEIIAAEDASVAASVVPQAERVSPGQALILADRMRRKGLLGDADALAQRAAAGEQSAEAAHMRSMIAYQSGKIAEAIEHLRHAIASKPGVALYHTNLGEMYRLAGHVDEAVAEGRRALELDAELPTALNNLGIALFEQGKFDEALALYQRAIALQEDFVQAHSNSGNALQRLKRPAEAEKAYRRAIDLQPDFGAAWNNLGTCLRDLHRPEEAEAAYRKSLELSPNSPDTLDNLALALRELERLDEAVDVFQQALSIEARNPQIYVHLASVYLDHDKIEECEAAIGRALTLNPNNPDAINLQGRVAAERGELEAAIASFQGAIALKPDLADAYNNMGNALKHIGRLDDAKAAYFEALRIDPKDVGIHLNLADSLTFDPGNPYLAAMEALDQRRGELSKTQSTQLDFALGKAYADLKDYRRSFAYLLKANASKRSTVEYDEESTLGLFDRIEAVFTPELIAAKSGAGDTSPMPIFVLGMPRSGTTLIEQIIASHPMVQGAGELRTLHEVILTVRGPDGKTVPYPECVPAVSASALRKIGEHYIAAVRRLAPSGERVTDKMPSNYYFSGLIHLALPNAKIIHTVRDPIDTCVSCFSKLFASPQNHTYDLGELGRYYKRYERLMAHWRRVLPAGRILDVRYEDVVADLEGQARRIIAHCQLPWDDRCLSFHETTRPVHTASATQVRRPIYKTAVGRWHAYEEELEPLLKALNIAEAARTA